ncbi:MAG TPA: hypothetical protein VG890_07790 [Puia sp.]|nr:hypothetical protein [Puia sp.]
MKTRKWVMVAGIAVTTVLIVHYVRTKRKKERKRIHIANEGYETAEDILYPRRGYLNLG